MANKTWDPDYFAEKRNNISEINISLKTQLSALNLVHTVPVYAPARSGRL